MNPEDSKEKIVLADRAIPTDEFELVRRRSEQNLVYREEIIRNFKWPVRFFPWFLMVLILLPILQRIPPLSYEKEIYSQDMQKAFLLALSVNFLGMFYIVIRDLFPQGKESSKEK
jgi:hypothetical protein